MNCQRNLTECGERKVSDSHSIQGGLILILVDSSNRDLNKLQLDGPSLGGDGEKGLYREESSPITLSSE